MSEFRQILAETAEAEGGAETTSTELVLPHSGVLIDLTSEREVAQAISDVKVLKGKLAHVERQLREVLAARSAKLGTKTFRVPGVGTLELKDDKKVRWDAEKLEELLREAGAPEELIREIVVETTEYKVDARRATQAAKANPEYASAVDACRTEEPNLPTVSIST